MEITGTVKTILPMQTGTGKNGEWYKQEIIIETPGEYPKLVCITAWKDLAKFAATLKAGQSITAQFDVESREYNGRYYTEVKAYKIDAKPVGAAVAAGAQDDLPF